MASTRDGIRCAVVQPHHHPAPGEERNVAEAVAQVAAAAAAGAELVLFPEGHPGPMRVESSFDAAGAMRAAAREHGVAVCWSRVERSADGRWRLVARVERPDGETALRYVRAHPATGDVHPVLSGTALAPGDGLGLTEVCGVRIGVLVCSELWIPEVARCLALGGAELLLAPAGGGFGAVAGNWRLIAQARAIENHCAVLLTQNRFGDEQGSALVAGPEGPLADGPAAELVVADVDLARLRWLRSRDDSMESPKPFRALPGLLRARRPELYGALVAARADGHDYAGAAAGGMGAGAAGGPGAAATHERAEVPHATARRFELRTGDRLRVTSPDGAQGGDLSFPGFDQAVTRNVNGWERHRRPVMAFHADTGMRLYDGDCVPVLEVVETVGAGRNDVVMPGCYREVYADGRPGCRELVSAALGIERRALTGMLSFFVTSHATDDFYDALSASQVAPGDAIELRALRSTAVAVSACPDTDVPGWRPGMLVVEVVRAGG
jgi:predicted amidohydrolase/uncharacterized protein YcgI (DUF1989 family)